MDKQVSLNDVLNMARRLPLADKVRLIERIAPQIEHELQQQGQSHRRSLRGLWKGLNITSEDIEAARQELNSGFPREDI